MIVSYVDRIQGEDMIKLGMTSPVLDNAYFHLNECVLIKDIKVYHTC